MSQLKTFRKGGRTWAYQSTPSGKTIGIYYEANLTEATRVANKFGEQYTGNENGRYYVLVSGYEKQQGGSWRYGPYPPGRETANGNASQVQSIGADVGLKQQITGSAPQNSSTTNPNQPGTQGTSTPTQTSQDQSTGESDAYLKYPIRMKDDQDRIMFQALTYTSSPSRVPSQGFEVLPVTKVATGPAVLLPIQSSITDQNVVGWEQDTLNPIEKQAVGLSRRIMESGSTTDITGAVSQKFTQALEDLRVSQSEVRTYLAGQAVGVNNLLSRLNGKVLNPNLELLFQSPQLRPFNFTFKLSPRSENEAKVVKKIIRYFKENMAPIVGDQGLFLKAPNVFKIQYQYKKNTIHPGLNLIKECALTNCSVDYTPNGTYMTYPEGTMVSYTLTLQFQELEPVYSRDYKDHPIGF
jgi:hypothetical protein